jgi:hypothetical protein
MGGYKMSQVENYKALVECIHRALTEARNPYLAERFSICSARLYMESLGTETWNEYKLEPYIEEIRSILEEYSIDTVVAYETTKKKASKRHYLEQQKVDEFD